MRGGHTGEFLFAGGQSHLGGRFLAGHARFEFEQRQLMVGKLFRLGPILVQAQEPNRLFQQLDFNRQPKLFRLGCLPKFLGLIQLAQDALKHRPERFRKRVEIQG